MQNTGIDTSIKILENGVKYVANSSTYYTTASANDFITDFYRYTPSSSKQTIVTLRANGTAILLTNETYTDFWSLASVNAEQSRNCLNANTNKIAFTMDNRWISNEDYYAYILESGEILFAGRNSIYYGHKNINELN